MPNFVCPACAESLNKKGTLRHMYNGGDEIEYEARLECRNKICPLNHFNVRWVERLRNSSIVEKLNIDMKKYTPPIIEY